MRALTATGRTPDALESYRRHRTALRDELGPGPVSGLRDLHARVLRAELDPRSRGRPHPPPDGRCRRRAVAARRPRGSCRLAAELVAAAGW